MAVLNSSIFHQTSSPIFLDEIVCSGGESSLLECEYDTVHRCVAENDIAIICHRKFSNDLDWVYFYSVLPVQLPVSVKLIMLDAITTALRLCTATPVLATLDIP